MLMGELPEYASYQDNPEKFDRAIKRNGLGHVLEDDSESNPFELLDPVEQEEVLEEQELQSELIAWENHDSSYSELNEKQQTETQLELIARKEYNTTYDDLEEEEQHQVRTQYTNQILHSNGIGSADTGEVSAAGTISD